MAVRKSTRSTRAAAKATVTGKSKVTKAAPKAGSKRKAPTPIQTKANRSGKPPETVAAELVEKTQKQLYKQHWAEWLSANTIAPEEKLLKMEPDHALCITQTDCLKQYGLKPAELTPLHHFEKPTPMHHNATKLFFEDDVKNLSGIKLRILAGETDIGAVKAGNEVMGQDQATLGALDSNQLVSSSETQLRVTLRIHKGPASRTRARATAHTQA